MAIAPPASLNGRPRKQLSDQLDRLDDVLIGMEQLLPQAVAEAARDGIRQAFRDVVGELVTDPATLERLRVALVPEMVPLTVAPRRSAFARLKDLLKSAAAKAASAFALTKVVARVTGQTVTARVVERCTTAKRRIAGWTLLALPMKSIFGISLAIGCIVAVISLAAPHHVAAALSGIAAAVMTAFVQVGRWLRRQRATLGLA